MPQHMKPLSAVAVDKLAPRPGKHPTSFAVGGVPGLYLQVSPSGAKSWLLRYPVPSIPGAPQRRREMGLGDYPTVSLKDARDAAADARALLRHGADPIEQRRAAQRTRAAEIAKAVTFGQAARRLIDAKAPEWSNAKHAQQWTNTIETYCAALLSVPVKAIDTGMVMKVLEPIWQTKTETASRVRMRMEAVLDWATARKYRDGENPARWRGHLDKLLPKPTKVKRPRHHPALPYGQMADFMADLRQRDGYGARALEFAILTAARSGEVRGATWGEIDLDAATWTIPGERMKAGREHRVPLSDVAVSLLRDLPRIDGCPYLFASARNGELSDATLAAVIGRIGGYSDPRQKRMVTPHGFRSTFRDWCAEATKYPRDVAEMALAHAVKSKVEAAYRRGDLFQKRRELMDDWAAFVSGNVNASG